MDEHKTCVVSRTKSVNLLSPGPYHWSLAALLFKKIDAWWVCPSLKRLGGKDYNFSGGDPAIQYLLGSDLHSGLVKIVNTVLNCIWLDSSTQAFLDTFLNPPQNPTSLHDYILAVLFITLDLLHGAKCCVHPPLVAPGPLFLCHQTMCVLCIVTVWLQYANKRGVCG